MDIDDELEMLQRELMDVQQEKANPLSQRTVAEIMIKLYQEGFKFYATTDGNQYVTPHKLDNQIIQFVQQRGRTKIGILSQILNLNQDLIQSRMNIVCQKSMHIRNNDSLISRDYIKNFVHSINQRLQADGILELDELGLLHEFNMPFLMKIIEQNLADLDAEVVGHQLVTKEFRRMKKRRLLGFLLAINRPVNIQALLKSIKLNDSNSQALIQELISEGKLKGRCQNTYYIPDKFSKNQKQMAQKFFQANGYIDLEMLHKNFQISKPNQWLQKNLKGDMIIFQGVCFNKSKVDYYQSQIESLLKGEGFFEISTALPFELDEQKMNKFLSQICGVRDYILDQGICYSEQWLSKCVNEFRDKVVYEIFFRKNEQIKKKKGGKKEKQVPLTEQQIVQTLFDAGLAEYSVAENMASSLLRIISQRLTMLKAQLDSELNKSKGVINSAFLKYKKCKTITKAHQNMQRILNTIEKSKKKTAQENWIDPDFGPSQNNQQGKYSLIYYDGVPPPQWPPLENIKWVQTPYIEWLSNDGRKSKILSKSLFFNLAQILLNFNKNNKTGAILPDPNVTKLPNARINLVNQANQEALPSAPYCFRFFVGEKDSRYVIIDGLLPYIDGEPVSSGGLVGLMEKAYAKLRYCYKATLYVGIAQILFELVGRHPIKVPNENAKDEQKLLNQLIEGRIASKHLMIVMGEGSSGKKLKLEENQTQLRTLTPYHVVEIENDPTSFIILPGEHKLDAKAIPRLFKNVYLIEKQ